MAPVPNHGRPRRLHHLLGLSLDAAALWERGQAGLALAYVLSSVILALLGLFAGLLLVRHLASP